MKNWNEARILYSILGLFLLIYGLLPTSNSTMDGIGFAADARWGKDLFAPHHLLYTALLWMIGNFLQIFNNEPIDFLAIGKLMNAIFACGSLLFLFKCLKEIKQDSKLALALTFLTGSSFSVMRFATENEVYILPIFFSLIGTYCFLIWLKNQNVSLLVYTGFWLAFACLFHQIHVFWWIGIGVAITLKSPKNSALYGISAIIVPTSYTFVAVYIFHLPFSVNGVLHFVFDNFHSGNAYLSITFLGIARFVFSFIRTFFQIHGTTYLLFKTDAAYLVFAIILIFVSGFLFIRFKIWKSFKRPEFNELTIIFSGILILQLGFALVSMGNSEFMVMVPFLISLIFMSSNIVNAESMIYLAPLLFTWNIVFGLMVSHFYKFTGFEFWKEKALKNPTSIFFMRQFGEVSNTVYYETGRVKNNVSHSKIDQPDFKEKVDSLLTSGIDVYTDYVSKAPFLNTDAVLSQSKREEFYKKYIVVNVDSVKVYSGWEYLFQVKKP